MNVLLVCQCDKRALVESRRILDQFAERRGTRTWQTPITQAGLDTLRRLLRKTARKNTAVACHWLRGRDQSELLWIVGDARRFNAEGAVPTNTTTRDVLRSRDENDWHSLRLIHLLAALAALLHDLGKASRAFQERLAGKRVERNEYRHEWTSLRLFQAFVGPDATDEGWLKRLIEPSADDDRTWTERLQCDGLDAVVDKPLASLPPLARVVGWLVVTHHRLPMKPASDSTGKALWLGARDASFRAGQLDDLLRKIAADWNERPAGDDRKRVEAYWHFPKGLPVTSAPWRKRAARVAQRLLPLASRADTENWLDDPYLMHLSRLSLMLADHHYSGLTAPAEREKGEEGHALYANTDRSTGQYNQPLDEHLIGVEKHAGIVVHALPGFERELPRLARHKGLRKRSLDERFRWQDRASDTAAAIRERAARQGAFIVNMASTGCGKTLANARIMYALADPDHGLRCAFALGLRTLTLQTGQAFRALLQASEDELAIRVGGAAGRELFEHFESLAERSGSASSQALLPEDGRVLYEGNLDQPLLQRAMKDPQVRALLAAPMLVCTVDHLVPATENTRGGRQIAPMLRLMSSDLVLDELDDFDLDDLPALTRLVYWSGLLGTRVLVSSATLPPSLVKGMYEAYRAGRAIYQRHRGEPYGAPVDICCAWFDEFHQQAQDCADDAVFEAAHLAFAEKRHARLGQDLVRRRARLEALDLAGLKKEAMREQLALKARDAALALHVAHHTVDPGSGKRVSFGLIRMANISPLVDVALALYRLGVPAGFRIHLCVYHSQFPLLMRSAIERRLDQALDRRKPDAVFALPDIRSRLDAAAEADQLFIVLGSPVTEVGRDHDYDWAVVEPSSMRSLIQLAGRVRRHRLSACDTPNLAIFDHNLKCFEDTGKAAYCQPGFEGDEEFRLSTHSLQTLLREDERDVIDARPRIVERPEAERRRYNAKLVDLEHERLRRAMQRQQAWLNASSFWAQPLLHLTGVAAQQQPFRQQTLQQVEVCLLPNDDEDDCLLHRLHEEKDRRDDLWVDVDEARHHRVADHRVRGIGIDAWAGTDYLTELAQLAEVMEMPLLACAERYGGVTLPRSDEGWWFHPALGFSRKR
ncbi:type I-F CRISPR-associated helicase Cas3f [Nevskia sp.]|uniref:type I-F CRISPR-associated helicase Cas3f n=1 Tax=Nevskia sp. TaxID=1929292 RepID=UPI003F72290A